MFFRKRKEKKLLGPTINPMIMDGFLNKIQDIICIAEYNGRIETINKNDIDEKYHYLQDLLNEKENKELYKKIIDTVLEEGCFINDIEIAIMKLPEIYKEVFLLKYSHELENYEIAKLLDIKESTVRVRLARGKEKLEFILNKMEGVDNE